MRSAYFPQLQWNCKLEVLSFLTIKEVWLLGCTSRGAFVTFLRERDARIGETMSSSQFLPNGHLNERSSLVSYPRSGNSYLRRLLEQATGIATGSDSRPNRTLTSSLLRCGFKGEGVCDESVQIVKSHFPERMGYVEVKAKRVILLIRNPFDSMESYFNMGFTNTHDKSLSSDALKYLKPLWTDFVKTEIQVWIDFHQYWLDQALAGVPVLVVRFEDLLSSESESMERIFRFISASRISSTYYTNKHQIMLAQKDIKSFIGPGYVPRKVSKSRPYSFQPYDEEQIEFVAKKSLHLLDKFGYKVFKIISCSMIPH